MAAPTPSAATAPARPAHRGPVLVALMVTMALSAMDNTIVSTAIPQVVRDLGGFSLFSWVFSSYLLTQTVSIPVYGKLADLWGRKPVLVAGTVIFLIGSALCASAWSPALTRAGGLGQAAARYLRAAITAATHNVYLALALAAVATLVGVLVLMPRRFATSAGATASSGPAGNDGRAAPVAPARGKPS
jgi:MFS family permease